MTIHFSKKTLYIILAVLSVAFIFYSYIVGKYTDEAANYWIFWNAARNFASNDPVYMQTMGEGFVYPPFFAMIFQPFGWIPFHTSGIIYSFLINYGLWIYSFYLVYRILKILFPETDLQPALLFAVLASARYFLYNFIWLQVNVITLCCTLLGLLFYLEKKYTRSYIFLLAGCFIKITPVLFLIYIAFKRGYKDWPKIILLSLPFIILPFLFRGWERGINDWVDYYTSFFSPMAKGYVDPDDIALGIPAMIQKLNAGNVRFNIGQLFSMQENVLKIVTLAMQIAVFVLLWGKIILDNYRNKAASMIGTHFCFLFLMTLLLPGRVWEHHHVCTGFIFAYLFVLLTKTGNITTRNILAGCAIVIGLIGRDTIGRYLYHLSQHFSLITLLLIAITITLAVVRYPTSKFSNLR